MHIIFDLSDDKTKTHTEYTIEEICFIPRVGEIISFSNKATKLSKDEFKVKSVKYEIMQIDLNTDQHVGKGFTEEVRVTAIKIS